MSIEKLFSEEISRREFIRNTGRAALAVGAGLTLDEVLSGCATISFKETAPVIYPPLKGHKVQPRENGCLFGIYNAYGYQEYYEKKLGRNPAILVNLNIKQYLPIFFPGITCEQWARKGIVLMVMPAVSPSQFKKDILNGSEDFNIEQAAAGAIQYGEKYGGFFLNPMWEMNIDRKHAPYSWCDQPTLFKKIWRYIWQIFEDKGSNEYATWVIEYHVDFPFEGYWPGDKFVDWIGLSGHNRQVFRRHYGYRYLDDLISGSYAYFRRKYKDKPIMQAEFSTTYGKDQPEWLIKAFKTIKSRPGMKAAIYFDNLYYDPSGWTDDHSLSQESLKTLKEILKDPYWIMAK